MSDPKPKFNARAGLYFIQESNGAVTVGIEGKGEVAVDPNTWASAVASMSRHGDTAEAFDTAYHFHLGRKCRCEEPTKI